MELPQQKRSLSEKDEKDQINGSKRQRLSSVASTESKSDIEIKDDETYGPDCIVVIVAAGIRHYVSLSHLREYGGALAVAVEGKFSEGEHHELQLQDAELEPLRYWLDATFEKNKEKRMAKLKTIELGEWMSFVSFCHKWLVKPIPALLIDNKYCGLKFLDKLALETIEATEIVALVFETCWANTEYFIENCNDVFWDSKIWWYVLEDLKLLTSIVQHSGIERKFTASCSILQKNLLKVADRLHLSNAAFNQWMNRLLHRLVDFNAAECLGVESLKRFSGLLHDFAYRQTLMWTAAARSVVDQARQIHDLQVASGQIESSESSENDEEDGERVNEEQTLEDDNDDDDNNNDNEEERGEEEEEEA
jgi:hypothetical protein